MKSIVAFKGPPSHDQVSQGRITLVYSNIISKKKITHSLKLPIHKYMFNSILPWIMTIGTTDRFLTKGDDTLIGWKRTLQGSL